MQRPTDIDQLIGQNFFEIAPATEGAALALLQSVREQLCAYEILSRAGLTNAAFGAIYDGFSQLLQAMFEHYEVRPPSDQRAPGGYSVCKSLNMSMVELLLISNMHSRRHHLSTECPFPPATADESQALARLVEKYIPVVHEIIISSALA
jgi:hypothetical protein